MTNKIITVTSGHSNTGKIDSGAVTTVGGKLIKEADMAMLLRNTILYYLQQDKDIITRCDGYGAVNLELKEAIKLIEGSDVAVEVHFNSSNNKTANGVECIVSHKDTEIGQRLAKAVTDVTGWKLRGTKGVIREEDSHRGRLAFVKEGSCILEVAFISNPDEMEVFNQKYWLIAKSISEVLIDYVKNKK
jgi:N-acetylmuramoyl-L-alanine amidase